MIQDADLAVLIRRPRPSDQAYVAATWANSLCEGDRSLGKRDANKLVDRMIDRDDMRITLAVEPSKPEKILGWIATSRMGDRTFLHYVYSRDKMRRRGVATALWSAVRGIGKVLYTMRGPEYRWLAEKHPGAIHIPVEDYLE
jgi:ribosomal protein S18 acetylase RimI-like enzyme